MSPLVRGLLRPALNTTMAAGLAGAVLVGGTTAVGPTAVGPTAVGPTEGGREEPILSASGIVPAAAVTTTTTSTTTTRRHRGFSGDWRARVLRIAKAQTGDRYRYGAIGPNSFDCSGLTSYVYRKATGKRLPHSSSAQRGRVHRISARAARPGDLVFFSTGGHVYHVGIYVGHHTIIHAPYPGQRVKRERIWTSSVTYGRVA